MGRPKICNPCCEGGAGTSSSSRPRYGGSTVPCLTRCIDSVAPSQWSLTISGVTAGSCSSGYCTQANRTWLLSSIGNCTWNEVISTGAFTCFTNAAMQCSLSIDTSPVGGGSSIYVVFARAAALKRYVKLVTYPIDCLVSHVLPEVAGDSIPGGLNCTGWPSSITVSPA